MRLLNLGCGGLRYPEPWVNCDQLLSVLKDGTPERANLLQEKNYVDCDALKGLPFPHDSFDGLAALHVLEHFSCHDAVKVIEECKRVLKPGGYLVASVPDTDYFLQVYDQDTKESAIELFGEPIHDAWQPNFFSYALFRHDHIQLLTASSLKCLFLKAGFTNIIHWNHWPVPDVDGEPPEAIVEINKIMNRRKFSLEMAGVK